MSSAVLRFMVRLQKMYAPTVHVLVAKSLFAYMLERLLKEHREPEAVNRGLFREGVWVGSLAITKLASPAQLKRFRPGPDLERTRRGVELYGAAAWYIFAGHVPSVRTEVADREGVIWIEIREDASKDAFYKIVVPEGVNTLYFVAGAYEGATATAFRLVGVEGEWFNMWRPLGGGGICGFYAPQSLAPSRVAEVVRSRSPEFFRVVSWDDSARFLRELINFEIPQPP